MKIAKRDTVIIILMQGVVKPDIVFFGEQLPSRFYSFLKDMPRAELLIVMGTSLEVIISIKLIYLVTVYT